jgi:hypothetical protein
MIEWKDAKEVLPHPKRILAMLDENGDLFCGYYCIDQECFFHSHSGDQYKLDGVTHWDYFEYPR